MLGGNRTAHLISLKGKRGPSELDAAGNPRSIDITLIRPFLDSLVGPPSSSKAGWRDTSPLARPFPASRIPSYRRYWYPADVHAQPPCASAWTFPLSQGGGACAGSLARQGGRGRVYPGFSFDPFDPSLLRTVHTVCKRPAVWLLSAECIDGRSSDKL